ncbi:hypothetical protein Dsin_013869 [Dipteronia sinensis]|uniref:Uncharacterized protein n=1 Tax=Dipteronia sinensis TaxID=43782 RepID=A0AAE0AM02_9ROSI|nr:hypothetical protein Dsin_013869 [Dipteronia sinensis]
MENILLVFLEGFHMWTPSVTLHTRDFLDQSFHKVLHCAEHGLYLEDKLTRTKLKGKNLRIDDLPNSTKVGADIVERALKNAGVIWGVEIEKPCSSRSICQYTEVCENLIAAGVIDSTKLGDILYCFIQFFRKRIWTSLNVGFMQFSRSSYQKFFSAMNTSPVNNKNNIENHHTQLLIIFRHFVKGCFAFILVSTLLLRLNWQLSSMQLIMLSPLACVRCGWRVIRLFLVATLRSRSRRVPWHWRPTWIGIWVFGFVLGLIEIEMLHVRRMDYRLRGGPDREDTNGPLFEGRIVRCATKVPHWLDMGMILAKQDYEIENLNERDCEPFRWCCCDSGLSTKKTQLMKTKFIEEGALNATKAVVVDAPVFGLKQDLIQRLLTMMTKR